MSSRTWAAAATDNEAPSGPKIKIRAVDAYHVYIDQRSDRVLDTPAFSSDDDPERAYWGGPFEQLPSAIIAVVKTDQGITGFGMGAGGGAAIKIIHEHLRHLLVGANPLRVETLWDQMYTAGLFYGRRGLFPMALSAVDNALWDIVGKHADKTVHSLLGGKPNDRVAIYQTAGDVTEGKRLGIRHFKRRLRIDPDTPEEIKERTIDDVLKARETMGPDGNLMTDSLSRAGTVERAIEAAERLRPANLYFMEEMLSPDDVFGYAELVKRIGSGGKRWTRIACGEHEYTHHGFNVLVNLRAADVLQPDMTWCGGLTAGRRIAALVEGAGLEFIPHRGGSLWGLPIALTSPSCTMAESLPTGFPLLDAMSPRHEDGEFLAPTGAGFGTSLTEELVREHEIKPRTAAGQVAE
jgi:L-rhamnonate dehydratase